LLKKSLHPVPQELNEIDWKSGLSDKSDRLAQHISVFANHANGGYLAFGIDRAIESIEVYQLPAPKFIRGDDYTRVIMYAPTPLTRMNNDDRIRACYQHTCLQYVNNQQVNNQSVRKRFNIAKNNVSFASKIIADTLEAGLIKASDPENASKKFASYVPFWT
jgi:predicted HTH transcriptional regulator